ncbi:hypothetical protein QQ045_015527 [Rhodiola kirilowii]
MSDDEFEPLFDYHRVQPSNFISLDDDDDDVRPAVKSKKQKTSAVEKMDKDKVVVVDCEEEDEEDWLPPPPDVPANLLKLGEDSTIKKLRLQRQELVSTINQDVDVEDPVREEISSALNPSQEEVSEVPAKPLSERAKVVISIQDKDGLNQCRIYMDEKLERLFNNYATKMKLDAKKLVFCFDGDKINSSATPASLGMEDDDIIEVHVKSS